MSEKKYQVTYDKYFYDNLNDIINKNYDLDMSTTDVLVNFLEDEDNRLILADLLDSHLSTMRDDFYRKGL